MLFAGTHRFVLESASSVPLQAGKARHVSSSKKRSSHHHHHHHDDHADDSDNTHHASSSYDRDNNAVQYREHEDYADDEYDSPPQQQHYNPPQRQAQVQTGGQGQGRFGKKSRDNSPHLPPQQQAGHSSGRAHYVQVHGNIMFEAV